MENFNLEIQLTSLQPQAAYVHAGEMLEGNVLVSVTKTTHCKGLFLSLEWETVGKGNSEKSKAPLSEKIYEGEFVPDQLYSLPFQLKIPAEGPFSYRGQQIQLNYFLHAIAKIAFRKNPETRIPLVIVPSLTPDLFFYPGNLAPTSALTKIGVGVLVFYLGSIFLFFTGAVLFYSGLGLVLLIAFLLPNSAASLHYSLALFTFWLLCKGGKRFIPWAKFKIQNVHLEIQSPMIHPGEILPFHLTFDACYPVWVNKVQVKLLCEETVISGYGKGAVTSQHNLFKYNKEFLQEKQIEIGEPQEILDSFRVPEDAPYFLELNFNKIRCQLVIEFHLKHCLKYTLTRHLMVFPPGYLPHPKASSMQAILKYSKNPYFRVN